MPKTYLITWNPARWTDEDYDLDVASNARGEPIAGQWATGNTKSIVRGDHIFFLRQGTERGIIGHGLATSKKVFPANHWDGSGRRANYVKYELDKILSLADRLPLEDLVKRMPEYTWGRIQASGFQLPANIERITHEMWKEHLLKLSNSKRGKSSLPAPLIPQELPSGEKYFEGAATRIEVNAYERDRKARKACIEHFGPQCRACGFDFEDTYGLIGRGYIHVHHLLDLSEIGEEYQVDPKKDLRPVCPNCHAMLHTCRPAMSISKLRKILKG